MLNVNCTFMMHKWSTHKQHVGLLYRALKRRFHNTFNEPDETAVTEISNKQLFNHIFVMNVYPGCHVLFIETIMNAMPCWGILTCCLWVHDKGIMKVQCKVLKFHKQCQELKIEYISIDVSSFIYFKRFLLVYSIYCIKRKHIKPKLATDV